MWGSRHLAHGSSQPKKCMHENRCKTRGKASAPIIPRSAETTTCIVVPPGLVQFRLAVGYL